MAIVRPEWAKAAIIAEFEEDISDPMSDYYGTKRTKMVVLAWSKHTRDLFPEMKKAADLLSETQYLGTAATEDFTHRQKWSMGRGYFLKGASRTGWRVYKDSYNWGRIEDAIADGNHVFDGNRPTCLQEVEEVAAVEPANNVIPFRSVTVAESVPNYVVITDAPAIEPVIISAEKKKPVKVELLRAEGAFDDCVKITIEQTFGTGDVIVQANQILRLWAMTAPDSCGYDKCDFNITYDDGEVYKGRYDLTRDDVMRASLKTHIEEYAEHVNDPDFASIPSYQEAKVYFAQFLSQYHIG